MPPRNAMVSAVLAVALGSTAAGVEPPTRPAPSGTTTAATVPAIAPAARKILDSLEKAGQRYRTVTALIGYRVEDRMTGDVETRAGAVKYSRATKTAAAKFHVRFDTLQQGRGRPIKDRIEYGFDGLWLTVAKYRLKQMTRYQVAARGERVQPLRLGKGPFPLPFGQKAEDIVKYFEVKTRGPRKTDPKDADYLKLSTRARYKREMSFLSLEMWIDRKTHLPARIRSRDKNKKITTVVFSHVKTDVELPDAVFHMRRPPGWEYKVERLKGEKPVRP